MFQGHLVHGCSGEHDFPLLLLPRCSLLASFSSFHGPYVTSLCFQGLLLHTQTLEAPILEIEQPFFQPVDFFGLALEPSRGLGHLGILQGFISV